MRERSRNRFWNAKGTKLSLLNRPSLGPLPDKRMAIRQDGRVSLAPPAVVQEESNWRGTWILEVKDLQGVDWETELVPKEGGRGGKYQRRPTKHLPFMPETQQRDSIVFSDGGQDDLMVWLGKR